MTSLTQPLVAGRGERAAGAVAARPEGPRRGKHLWQQMVDYTKLRFRLASFFVRRGLGILPPRTLDPALLAEGLTLVLPGIEAESIFTYAMCDGLLDGGVKGAIRVFNWGMPLPGGYLANLTRLDRNRRRAADIAREVVAYQDAYPGQPVHLVAQSGGGGIAVFAAEAMPEGRMIDGVVLLGGALSPEYNLAAALRKTRKGIFSSHSCKDRYVLGWGTRLFGTTDRKFTRSCGCEGFRKPANLTAEEGRLYDEKLQQLAWTPEMADAAQHWGGHLSWGSEEFLMQRIAPWVREGGTGK